MNETPLGADPHWPSRSRAPRRLRTSRPSCVGGWRAFRPRDQRGQLCQRRAHAAHLLVLGSGGAHGNHRGCRRETRREQICCDLRRARRAHQDDGGAPESDERLEVAGREQLGVSWPLSSLKERETPRQAGGTPAAAGATSTELIPGTTANSTPTACSASAPRAKTNGSPRFGRPILDDKAVDLRLRHRGRPRCLPDVRERGERAGAPVVEHHVHRAEGTRPAHADEVRVARSRADEIDGNEAPSGLPRAPWRWPSWSWSRRGGRR